MNGFRYDGTFDGFLTCVFTAFARHADPSMILAPDKAEPLLFAIETICTETSKARRVENGIRRRSEQFWEMVRDGFLCEMAHKETTLLKVIRLFFRYGPSAAVDYADPDVSALWRALRTMREEGHLLEGFVRFSEYDGVLVSVIAPKNQVLPMLAQHFSVRFPGERFMIYDSRHKVGFIHTLQKSEFLEIESLILPPVGGEEAAFQAMWRDYVAHIAIRERDNPICQRTHLSLRYRPWMTEFQGVKPEEDGVSPSPDGCAAVRVDTA